MLLNLRIGRWPVLIVLVFAILVLTACPPPSSTGPSAGRTAANRSGKGSQSQAATKTSEEQKGAPNEERSAAASTTFFTPTPGPAATATPEPLASADPEQAIKLAAEAKELFLKSDLQGAEAKAIEAIAADPSSLSAYLQLADVYLYWPHYWQQALGTAEAAAKLAPDDPVVLAYLAWAQQGAHHFDDAKTTALRAAELGPELAITHQALADILSSIYELDEAYAQAQRAVELDDKSASAWASLGAVANTLEYLDEAGDAYAQAAKLESEFFAWSILLARHELNATGDVDIARELAETAFQVQPDHPFVLSLDVDLALESNDWETAEAGCIKMMAYNQPATIYPDAYSCMAGVKLYQEDNKGADFFQKLAEEIAPPARRDVSILRMRLLNDDEKCAESRELAEDWLQERPYSVLAIRMVGVSYLCEENFAKAEEYFQQALDKMPRSIGDARLLANTYARDEKASEARSTLNLIKSFAAENPLYYQALYEVHLFLGQTKDAIKAAQRWQVLRPTNTEAMISLALAELFNDNPSTAQSYAQSALDAGATGSTLYAILGQSYSRQGNFEQAEEYLLQALAINDKHFLARSFIAQLYLFSGQCDKAEPHVDWLKADAEKDNEGIKQYEELLKQCKARAERFTPDPATALEDDAVIVEVRVALKKVGVEVRSVEFSEEAGERNLFVAFSSDLDKDSDDFATLEHDIALLLARLLPRISSQPQGLLILSGAKDEPQNVTYIPTWAAFGWSNGDLSDAEFEETWLKQTADGSGEGQ
jgi:tetratricopeptide (TPR) repeat protein